MTITLASPAFTDGSPIPDRHARLGENVPPPLTWSGVPPGAEELALVVQDPDAPSGTFTHWILTGLEPGEDFLAEGQLPPGAVEGSNDFGEEGYGGPRPPEGDPPHRYVFTLIALDGKTDLSNGASIEEFQEAVQGKELDRGQLVGQYSR